MKKQLKKGLNLLAFAAISMGILGLTACTRTTETINTSTTSEVTDSSQQIESRTIQTRRGPRGVMLDEQVITEKATCVDAKGNRIKARNYKECIKAGGKVIEEEVIDETSYKR